jgi:uncharacterized membrane protein
VEQCDIFPNENAAMGLVGALLYRAWGRPIFASRKKQETSMSKFVVVIFPDEAKITQGTRALKDLHAEGIIKLYASAVVARDSGGKLSVQEVIKEEHGGTAVGALIGGLAGLPAGPLAATIGAASGAIFGISADLINQNTDTEFVDKVSRELTPGKAAVVAEVAEDGALSFEALMESIGGTVVGK